MNIKRLEFRGIEIVRYNLGLNDYIFRIPSMELDCDTLEEAQAIISQEQSR